MLSVKFDFDVGRLMVQGFSIEVPQKFDLFSTPEKESPVGVLYSIIFTGP